MVGDCSGSVAVGAMLFLYYIKLDVREDNYLQPYQNVSISYCSLVFLDALMGELFFENVI